MIILGISMGNIMGRSGNLRVYELVTGYFLFHDLPVEMVIFRGKMLKYQWVKND